MTRTRRLAPLLLSAAALLLAPAAQAQEARPSPEAPPEAGGPLEPLPRPATEGETEADIEAEAQPAPDAAIPAPLARPDDLAPPRRGRPAPGWTLRDVPGSGPVALAGGPGQVFSASAFCLGGRPWLALELDPPSEAASVRADFGFASERVEADALREEGAGGAFVVELADSPLAGLLAGADSAVALGIDGTQQGPLSLAGSTRALRAALADCHDFP